jgi:hypothetical protein
VQIPEQGTSQTFPITVLSNTQNTDAETFHIIASLTSAVGKASSASTSFTVTGIPVPSPLQ